MQDQLSLCMIVRNEERTLSRCLDSARSLARELIVVDTGSTDRTQRIAARYGAEVIPFDFARPDFAAARNRAIACATGRWILMLDADETVDQSSAPLIETLVALGTEAGYFFERRNHIADSADIVTDYVVRLFPNRPAYRFRGRVHETIDASILENGGRLLRTAIRIDHSFSSRERDRRGRNLWYVEILKEEIESDPTDASRLNFLAAEYHQLNMFDEATEVAERIARLTPMDHKAHLFAGIYHLVYQANPARARADFRRVLALCPDHTEAKSFLQLTL
jgi:glycosyltransferase involved in cell wall biosynthesis